MNLKNLAFSMAGSLACHGLVISLIGFFFELLDIHPVCMIL